MHRICEKCNERIHNKDPRYDIVKYFIHPVEGRKREKQVSLCEECAKIEVGDYIGS